MGVKPSFCKAYTWTEVEFVIANMVSLKEIIWSHGNNCLETILTDMFGGWEHVHIGKELRDEINKYSHPLRLAPNELAAPGSVALSQSSGLSLSQAPMVKTPASSQSFSPNLSPASQTTPSQPSSKRPLYASPGSSQDSPVRGLSGTQSIGGSSGKRTQVVSEDIRTASNVLWTTRSLSMGATYQLELIDGLIEELSSLPSEDADDEVLETEYGDDDKCEENNHRAGPSFRRASRGRHY
ncbi:hypothetical protein FRC11_002290 [Ceratobasidium sp. 423]|nr:hypothetical protein FRC11_002290 [Ceratobasidium sp. 423]